MSSMRQDPSHRPGPVGRSRVHTPGDFSKSGPEGQNTLSVIVPAKNESASLPQLVDEIAQALRPLCVDGRMQAFEIVVVDDGSTDATPEVLRSLYGDYPELRPVTLAANVGSSRLRVMALAGTAEAPFSFTTTRLASGGTWSLK
ncbi:glycosyltransferase family 2 protein, partial [Singulisphaera rosea]